MSRKSILTVLMAGALVAAGAKSVAAQGNADASRSIATQEIRRLVDTYMQSVDDADPKLGATVWSPTADVTFIEPLGHERGWDEIARVVYGKLMGQTFRDRKSVV